MNLSSKTDSPYLTRLKKLRLIWRITPGNVARRSSWMPDGQDRYMESLSMSFTHCGAERGGSCEPVIMTSTRLMESPSLHGLWIELSAEIREQHSTFCILSIRDRHRRFIQLSMQLDYGRKEVIHFLWLC